MHLCLFNVGDINERNHYRLCSGEHCNENLVGSRKRSNSDNPSKATQFPGSRHEEACMVLIMYIGDRKSTEKKNEGTSKTEVSGQFECSSGLQRTECSDITWSPTSFIRWNGTRRRRNTSMMRKTKWWRSGPSGHANSWVISCKSSKWHKFP